MLGYSDCIWMSFGSNTYILHRPISGTYAAPYVRTVPDIPNIFKQITVLTNVGPRVGHQSGLYESSDKIDKFLDLFCGLHLFGVFPNR